VGLSFDKAKGIYRTASGKEIPYAYVRGAVDAVADDTKARLLKQTNSYLQKKTSFAAWASESEDLIRKSLVASGQIAAGGRAQMNAVLNGRLGAAVKFHLQKFREFGLAIERGELSDAQILERISMYADATVAVFEGMRLGVMLDAGFTEARTILAAAKHCDDCPKLVNWMPIENYPPPGTRACLTRCRCGSEFR
jgi:hypothetical protein